MVRRALLLRSLLCWRRSAVPVSSIAAHGSASPLLYFRPARLLWRSRVFLLWSRFCVRAACRVPLAVFLVTCPSGVVPGSTFLMRCMSCTVSVLQLFAELRSHYSLSDEVRASLLSLGAATSCCKAYILSRSCRSLRRVGSPVVLSSPTNASARSVLGASLAGLLFQSHFTLKKRLVLMTYSSSRCSVSGVLRQCEGRYSSAASLGCAFSRAARRLCR